VKRIRMSVGTIAINTTKIMNFMSGFFLKKNIIKTTQVLSIICNTICLQFSLYRTPLQSRLNIFFLFLHKSCWILLCRFRVESVNIFIYNTTCAFFNKQFRTCANALQNEVTVIVFWQNCIVVFSISFFFRRKR
jgi:hypothetical protein